jgi:glycosyltransferase involved in cell wall biosynthesis
VRASIPVVFHAHNRVALLAGRPLVRWSLRVVKPAVIAASRFVASEYRHAEVIYAGVTAPERPPGKNSRPRIGMIGRITAQKRQREFVMAAAQLAREYPEVECVLCGDSTFGDTASAAYRQEVLRLAPPSLRFLGWRDDVGSVLSRLDLLVLPSAGEGGVPRVVLEAFACGVPVLAMASGAVPEAVEEGTTGFLLGTGRAEEIARRVRELLPQRHLLLRVAAGGKRLWQDRFQVESYQDAVCTVLSRQAVGARPALRA